MCCIATKLLFSEISAEVFPAVSLSLKGALDLPIAVSLPSFFQRERLLSCEEGMWAGQLNEGMASGGGAWEGKGHGAGRRRGLGRAMTRSVGVMGTRCQEGVCICDAVACICGLSLESLRIAEKDLRYFEAAFGCWPSSDPNIFPRLNRKGPSFTPVTCILGLC